MECKRNINASAPILIVLVLLALGKLEALQEPQSHTHHGDSSLSLPSSTMGKIASNPKGSSSTGPARRPRDAPRPIIDLSHPLHNGTLHWPQNSGTQYLVDVEGERQKPDGGSYFVKSDKLNTAVHSGTHLDAPVHFSKTGWTVEKIPLERLVDVPISVIDLSQKVAQNRTYSFLKNDFIDSNTNTSLVLPRSVVLVYTGISEFYDKGPEAYFGTADKNITNMKSPGFSREAANYMVEQGVYGVGLDAASADSSDVHSEKDSKQFFDPIAHEAFNSNNIYILENISKRLKELVGQSNTFRLTIAPLPIVSGSGSPVRLLATAGHDDSRHCTVNNGAPASSIVTSSSIAFVLMAVSSLILMKL